MDRDLNVLVRVVRRLRSEDDGFTIVEVMVASLILLIAILSTAYTATIGFTYSARARQKQDATGVANSVFEDVQGFSETILMEGLDSADLDANNAGLVPCAGDSTTWCLGTSSGEQVLESTATEASVLNPHESTVEVGPTTFYRTVFITKVDGGTDQLRVTIEITWGTLDPDTGEWENTLVLDKVLETTTSCPIETLHPFGGPCGTVVTGEANISDGSITVSPYGSTLTPPSTATADIAPFTNVANLLVVTPPSVGMDLAAEQAGSVSGSVVTSGGYRSLTTVSGQTTTVTEDVCGTISAASAANDTEQGSDPFSQVSPTDQTGCIAPGYLTTFLTSPPSTTVSRLVLEKRTADASATTVSSVTAAGSEQCPSGSNSSAACGYGTVRQAGTTWINSLAYAGSLSAGNCGLVQSDARTSASSVQSQKVGGKVVTTITRNLPNVTIGCLPPNLTSLANGTATVPPAWNAPSPAFTSTTGRTVPGATAGTYQGYMLRMYGMTETTIIEAGTGAANPVYSRSGSIRHWNGSGYTTTTITNNTCSPSCTISPATLTLGFTGSAAQSKATITGGTGYLCARLTPTSFTVPSLSTSASTTSFPDPLTGFSLTERILTRTSTQTCDSNAGGGFTTALNVTVSPSLGTATASVTADG
ncbi:MAG: type II secretion system protein [Actinomycetota bacterium]